MTDDEFDDLCDRLMDRLAELGALGLGDGGHIHVRWETP